MNIGHRTVIAHIILLTALSSARAENPVNLDPKHSEKMAEGRQLFKAHVRPIFIKKCLKCHGDEETEAGLDISTREKLLKGGENGPAVLAGRSKDSFLYQIVTHEKEPFMPFLGRKLKPEEIAHIGKWIELGAPFDKPLIQQSESEVASWTQSEVSAESREHWAYQPLKFVLPPQVNNAEWCRTPIDKFILARMEKEGVKPSGPISRGKLLRRAYFGLIGLPPTPEELDQFLQDESPDDFEKVIDRLLGSAHYGERWGRHWLDLARFAESHGFEHDYDRPTAYHYRDFVIQALNDDMPYDQFVKWQIAGDELAPDDRLAQMATGYLAAGVHSTQITKSEVEKHRYDEMDDMLATIGTSMLGLTIGCARCHDHKFDAIPQADYYRLLSAFTTTVRSEVDLDFDPEGYRAAMAAHEEKLEQLIAALREFEKDELPERFTKWAATPPNSDEWPKKALLGWAPKDSPALLKVYRALDSKWRSLSRAVRKHENKTPDRKLNKVLISTEGLPAVRLHTQGQDFLEETHFLRRGDPNQKDGVAPLGYLQTLIRSDQGPDEWAITPPTGSRTSFRRSSFANWLTDTENGGGHLLARVIVNRLWQHHMGRGLVATPSDFGTRGARPTHPELLDWLASELIRQGWRLKPIHKLILRSATYRLACSVNTNEDTESLTSLFALRSRTRLEAEVIRDAMLFSGNRLDNTMYGPGTLDESSRRRSIYFTVKRSKLIPMMQIFDAPEALQSQGQRGATTVAPQALYLMNNPEVRKCAEGLAERVRSKLDNSLKTAIEQAYLIALSRRPRKDELDVAESFLTRQMESYGAEDPSGKLKALTDYCQTLFCLNEFVYVE